MRGIVDFKMNKIIKEKWKLRMKIIQHKGKSNNKKHNKQFNKIISKVLYNDLFHFKHFFVD
jgi:ATP-dependent protease Clp ATPase subunit